MSQSALPVIEVHNLQKVFQSYYDRPSSLKEAMLRFIKWKKTEVVALKGVSFEVMPGEVVGIIGRNGSGKTTLLAVLSGVYQKSRGDFVVRGRVASLLGVGRGFHPELTALENLKFVGVALGLSLAELEHKIDSIVAFAELEGLLEAPVRTFSSGMVVRMGFSLGVHAEPDIFLIDEQIHTTDESFQRKCLRKLQELKEEGKTILFVSHDLRWIEALAQRVLWLDRGELKADGEPKEVIERYLAFSDGQAESP